MNINFNDVDYVKHNNLDINAVKLNGEEIWRVGTTVNGVPPLTLSNATDAKLKKYKIYGNSVQDGTPTPDSPVEIQSVGDLSTKNLFDKSISNSTSIKNETVNSYWATTIYNNENVVKMLKLNTEYTISYDIDVISVPTGDNITIDRSDVGFRLYSSSTTTTIISCIKQIQLEQGKTYHFTSNFTTPDAFIADVIMLAYANSYVGKPTGWYTPTVIFRNIQIEEGSTATDYEPYHKYKIPVVARGRNLIKLNTKSYSANGGTITNNQDGTYTLSGTPTGHCGLIIGNIPSSLLDVLRNNVCVLTGFYYYEKNVRITLNVKLNGSYIKYIYLNPYTYKNYVQVDLRTTEFDEITFSLSNQNNNVDFKNVTVKPLLEVGTTMPTSFEPYIAPVTTHIFLDEPLRKVGDYADYIDFEKQKVVRKITHKEFSSSDGWSVYTTYPKHFQVYVGNNNYFGSSIKALSNYYPQYKTSQFAAPENNYAVLSVDGERIRFKDVRYTTVDEWKAFLDTLSTPLTVHYILKTPTEETVNLPALPQFKGTTIYEVGTTIRPSNMSVTYIKK